MNYYSFGAFFMKLNTVRSLAGDRSQRRGELESVCPAQRAGDFHAEGLCQHLPVLLFQEKLEIHFLYVVFQFGESH